MSLFTYGEFCEYNFHAFPLAFIFPRDLFRNHVSMSEEKVVV